jgi:hypothetical protein
VAPKIVVDTVLSGNKVIADEKTAGALSSVWRRAAAIEMEGAGLAAALHQSRPAHAPPYLLIKGICDKADSVKDDKWQSYAANVAAAFTLSFIETEVRTSDLIPPPPEAKLDLEINGIDARALRLAIAKAFDLTELKLLVWDLNTDWDDIKGETKAEKIVECIKYLKRRNRLIDLVELVKKERPGLLESYQQT